MKGELHEIIRTFTGTECEIVQKGFECEITSLTSDSRKVTENGVFICITGAVSDGHKLFHRLYKRKQE